MSYNGSMIDDFAKQIMKTLMAEMQAVTSDGLIDHKTRLAALKEARAFIQSLLPRLSEEDRTRFSHSLAQEMKQKLELAIRDEEKLEALKNDSQ